MAAAADASERDAADDGYIEADLSKDDVVSKYRQAADIVNNAIKGVLKRCVPGADVLELCILGDKLIDMQCAKAFKSKKVHKGVAFPTCISINNVVCHNSPMDTENSATLAEGDLVKVDMGAHLDGFIAVVAHTGIATAEGALEEEADAYAAGDAAASTSTTASTAAAASGSGGEEGAAASSASGGGSSKADVATAAHVCAELALRLVKPGNTNAQVTEAFGRVVEHFGVSVCQGVLSHELKQFVIDGSNVILARESTEDDHHVDPVVFAKHQVYAIDIACSTGDGKPKLSEARTTVYKRDVERSYGLKMAASRWLMRQVQESFPTLPFSLRAFGDEKQARVGVSECAKHGLVSPYPVLMEKKDEFTAHFKFTGMLLASGTLKATGLGLPAGLRSAKLDSLPDDLKALLATPSFIAKKKSKKSKKSKKPAAAPAAADE